jgi:integrase
MAKLTSTAAEQMKPGKTRREVADGKASGLYLVIQPNGSKSFALRFRSPVDRDKTGQRAAKKLTLGAFDPNTREEPKIGHALTLAGARTLAAAAMAKVERGVDPTHERRAERERERIPAPAADTVSDTFGTFMKRYAKVHTRESSWRETERIFKTRIEPKWGRRRVQDITKRDVIDLLDSIVDDGRGVLANRALAVVRKFFNWCLERDILAASPAAGVKPPAAEASRDRVLYDDELRALWQVAEGEKYPFGSIVKLLILSGQRVDEVREARWSEFDLDAAMWSIPGERTKNGRDHDVPLSPQAVDVLKAIPKIKSDAGLVFTTTGETPVSGMSRAKDRISDAVLAKLQEADPKVALERWTLHDVRRTFYSGLQRLGFSIEIAEAVVNHISGTRKGVAGVYGRHSYAAEKRAALEAWARHVDTIVTGKSANVIPLRGA